MKTSKLFLLVTFCCIAGFVANAQDRTPQGMRSHKFEPTLNGTWQLCTLTPGEGRQPQLTLLPVLKVIDTDCGFQNIGLPSEGACFIQKQGKIEKISDSTFVEHRFAMRRDSAMNDNTVYRFRLEGPMWLMIDYTETGKQEPTSELWLRVQPQRQRDSGQHAGKRPVSRQREGDKIGRKTKSGTGDYNPFAKETDADDDFEQ